MTMLASGSLPMVERADHVPGPPQGCWTYEDYAALPDDGRRYEIIDGVLYQMPSPNVPHQGVSVLISGHLLIHVQFTGVGKVFAAPLDVQLPLTPPVTVQPDVIVVLNAHLDIIKRSHIVGAPDLVVEISSPGTVGYDRRTKQDRYARAGVPEYWIPDPATQTIEVLVLEEGGYRPLGVFSGSQTLPSRVLPELPLKVEQFFA